MAIDKSAIEAARAASLGGEVTPSIGGGVTPEQIAKARQMTTDPAQTARLGKDTVGFNTRPDKYDFQMKSYADNEELRANAFGGLKSFGAGLSKLVANTAFELGSGAASVFIGLPSAFATGDVNQIFDNGISSAIDDAQTWVNDEVFPIYNSVKDNDKNILHRAVTDLEFWTDDILSDGVPFMLSAWLTAYAGVSALRPLTKARYLSKIEAAKGLGASATKGIAKSLQAEEQLAAAFLARTTEGFVEAKDTRDMTYEKLIAKGLSPDEASKEAGKAAMATFGLNYLLMPIEYIQAGSWFKAFGKSRDQLVRATKKGLELPKRYTLNKVGKEAGVNVITEGPIEENFQKAVQDYVYERFTGNDRGELRPWEDEFRQGVEGLFSRMGENFTTKEGWDAIGTGSILGGLFGGAAGFMSANSKAEKERIQGIKDDLSYFNSKKEEVNERVQNIVESLKANEALDKLSKVQQLKGKENFWNIFETLKFGEFAYANFEAGLGEQLQNQIDDAENLSDEEFLSGYKDKNKVKELKDKAVRYEELFNMINERFNVGDNKEGRNIKKSLFREAILQEELQREIEKIQPKVDQLRERAKPSTEYETIVREKNQLVRQTNKLKKSLKDIEAQEEARQYLDKAGTRIRHTITQNEKRIKELDQQKLAFVESQGDKFVKPKSKHSKALLDELKIAEDTLNELDTALEWSLGRYDALSSPKTQQLVGAILEQSAKANTETKETLTKVKEEVATQAVAQQVSQETGKPVEKVLSNVGQLHDSVTATLKADNTQIRGIVFEVNPDGTIKTVQSNSVIYPVNQLSNIIVTEKYADKAKTEDNDIDGDESMYDAMLKAMEDGTAGTFDPFAGKEPNKDPITGKTAEETNNKVDPQDSDVEEGAANNPDADMSDETHLFDERKMRINPYALGGLDIEYFKSGSEFIDRYNEEGQLIRGEQTDFYNYVNNPNNDLKGVVGKLTLIDQSGSPDSMHIQFTLPNGLSTSINTVEWVRNNVAKITDAEIKAYSKWRGQVVGMLQTGQDVNLTIASQGPGALLRNQKVGNRRGRVELADYFNVNTTPLGVTIKSKKGEQHVTRVYDWKGAVTPAVKEFFGFGKSGRTYIAIPAANGVLTPVPVWSRTLTEQEARMVVNAIKNRLEGRNYDTIPGSTWTYNDLIRFYVYPSSSAKSFDMFISDQDKTVRVGTGMNAPRYHLNDLDKYPQDLIAALMGKIHQVQTKRIINNEEIPLFQLVNDQLVVESTIRYREHLFYNVLETDIQPIELEDRSLYFGQPTINFDPDSVFTKTPVVQEEKKMSKEEEDAIKAAEKMFGLDEDDPFNMPANKMFQSAWYTQNVPIYDEKELLEVMRLLPQVPIKIVKDLIKVSEHGYHAVGTFHKGLITLYENAPSGTLYHEAFHAVFRMMLDSNERKQITEKYNEERLAEMFENYMLTDGKMPLDHQSTKNFFQRLWDMIKAFVLQMFGKVTPQDIFARIKTGYYKHFDGDPTKFSSIATKPYNLSPREEVALMNYMTQRFFAGVFRVESFDFTDIESIGLRNKDVVNIYNNIKATMQKQVDEARTGDLKSKHQHIIDNFEEVVNAHQTWMAKYKIVPPEIDYNPEEENLKLKDSFQFKEATEFSAKDNANYMVKLFIAGLPKMVYKNDKAEIATNELGLPEVTDYSETWNFLLETLSGVTSIPEASERLKPYFKIKPEIQLIYGILNKPGTFTQEIFKTQFLQSFSKFNTQPVTTLFNYGEGDSSDKLFATTMASEQQNYREIVRKGWEANLMGSDLVSIDPLSRIDDYISNNPEIEDLSKNVQAEIRKSKDSVKSLISGLEKFGITFTPNAIESWIDITENGKEKFTTAAKYIITKFGDVDFKDKLQLFRGFEEVGNLNLLADIEAKFNPSIFEAVHLNPERKPTYHYIQHNFLSSILTDVNKGDMRYITKLLNSYNGGNSKWAAALKAGVKPVIKLIEGVRLEGFKGKLTTKLTPGMWISMRMNNVLQEKPIFAVLRPAEKKSEYGIEGFELAKSGVVRNNNSKGLTAVDINSNTLIDQFFGYFEDEYKRTIYAYLKERRKANADIPVSLLQYLGLNSEEDISTDSLEPFDTRAKKMTFFGPIISQTNPTLLHSLENFHRPENDEIEDIRVAIKSYLVSQINRTFDYLNDQSVIQVIGKDGNHVTSRTDEYKRVKIESTDVSLDNVSIGKKQLDSYAGDIFAAVADFTVNEMISTFEFIKLTMGDVAYYKDFFKRTPLVTGTGKNARVDEGIAAYINPEYSKLRTKYPLTKSKEEIINGDFNVAVVKSVKKKSSQLKDMKAQLKSLGLKDTEVTNLLKGYEDYDESDAFSWITPQAAREFLLRIGDWNPSLESIYQNIIDEKPIKYHQLKHFMTAIKLMGAGPIDTGDTKVVPIAYLKTATLPIIPRAVKTKSLEKLLERMYQSGTDMVIVDSGSKGASHNIQPLYTSDGQINMTPLKTAKFNFKHIKLQIDVQQKSKNKVVFGTQLRKLVWSNIFGYDVDGKLIEKTFTVAGKKINTPELWKKFNSTYANVVGKYKDKLLKELGINFDFETETYQVVDWTNLVDKIKAEAESRFYPKSVVESIRLNPEKNGLDIPGDALVNRKSVENMLNAIVYNNIVAQKMLGTSSVQIPVTGFEDIIPNLRQKIMKLGIEYPSDVQHYTFAPDTFISEIPQWFDLKNNSVGIIAIASKLGINSSDFESAYNEHRNHYKKFKAYLKSEGISDDTKIIEEGGEKYFINEKGERQYIDESSQESGEFSGFFTEEFKSHTKNFVEQREQNFRSMKTYDHWVSELKNLQEQIKSKLGGESKTRTVEDSTGELKFISYENGQVMEAEVYLPHNFRSKAGYLNDLTIDQVDPEVLKFIGFRIPTEGLRSIIKIRVKGFLPREMGDVVVVPSELVAQAGSDFDIDKLNILQPHYRYNEESKRIERVKSDEDSIQGLENSILDIVDGLLSHKDAFVSSLRTTGETVDYLKSVATKIKQLKGEPTGREEDPLSIIEFDKKMDIAYKFIAGKDGVGVAALHNTHHVLTQAANIRLTEDATKQLNFIHNKNKDGKAILSGIKDVTGKHNITDILAASVNGFVDIVKDPFIIDLLTDLNTASIGLMINRFGAPIEWVAKFVNQPLIQRYIKNVEFARSEIGKITGLTVYQIKNRLREQYYNRLSDQGKKLVDTDTWQLVTPMFKNTAEVKLEQYMSLGFSEGQVNDTVADIANNTFNVTPDEYYLSQISFLNDFLQYQDLGNKMRLLMANTASDTYHAKTFNDADRFVRRKEAVNIAKDERLDDTFENYTDLFNIEGQPTFIQTFYNNGLKLEHQAFRKIFPIRQSERVQDAVRRIESLVGRTNKLRDYEIEKLSDSLMGYIFYRSFGKSEMSDFTIDQFATPAERLLVSSRMKFNLARGNTNKFIKKGQIYKKGDKLNLNDTSSVEIVGYSKLTPKEIMDRYPNEAPILGAKYFKGPVYVYQVKVIQNKLVKRSGIRTIHEYKVSKDAANATVKELQSNVFFNNLRVYFSRKAGGVNSIRFRARPTDNVVHEDLVAHWRKMFESGNPVVRDIAWKIAKYAIYQSGMKQSNISFFKYIPPEIFSEIVNQGLIDFDRQETHLDDPKILNIIFKNLWKEDTYVPPIRNIYQVVEINDDKGDTIGYRLRRNNPRNDRYFVNNAPPPFLKLSNKGVFHLMELVGFSNERQGGDAIYQITNKLGDGNLLSEYHEGASIYEDNNEYIEDIQSLLNQVSSSVGYWKTSAPLPITVIEKSIAPKSDTFADTESESGDDSSDDLDDGTEDMDSDWVDSFFQMRAKTSTEPDERLDDLLKKKLAEIGVQVQDVDKIYSKHSPVAVAKILEGVIKVAKGRADITTLPEEAAHIFVAMLDKSNPLLQKMLREVVDYKLYQDVVKEYGEAYNGDESKLRLEAVGKLIGNIIVNDFTGETVANVDRAKRWWVRLWEVLKKIFNNVTLGALERYTTNDPTVFERFAQDVINRRPNNTLSETIINNNFESIAKQMIDKGYLTLLCP